MPIYKGYRSQPAVRGQSRRALKRPQNSPGKHLQPKTRFITPKRQAPLPKQSGDIPHRIASGKKPSPLQNNTEAPPKSGAISLCCVWVHFELGLSYPPSAAPGSRRG